MKIALIALTAAAAYACTEVSVEGDATYCIEGPICGGTYGNCPTKYDIATKDCVNQVPSFLEYANICMAPEDAYCTPIRTGVYGCVWDSKLPQKAAPVVKKAATIHRHASGRCNEVSVEGDATYCVSGRVCSGSNYGSCPKRSDYAMKDCIKSLSSYVDYLSACVAPEDAYCTPIRTGVYGCVWDSKLAKPWRSAPDSSKAGPYSQCGGSQYTGPTACTTGYVCVHLDDYYSQCLVDTNAPGLPTWSQCTGPSYNATESCREEDQCIKYNDYYSQCVPRNN